MFEHQLIKAPVSFTLPSTYSVTYSRVLGCSSLVSDYLYWHSQKALLQRMLRGTRSRSRLRYKSRKWLSIHSFVVYLCCPHGLKIPLSNLNAFDLWIPSLKDCRLSKLANNGAHNLLPLRGYIESVFDQQFVGVRAYTGVKMDQSRGQSCL